MHLERSPLLCTHGCRYPIYVQAVLASMGTIMLTMANSCAPRNRASVFIAIPRNELSNSSMSEKIDPPREERPVVLICT